MTVVAVTFTNLVTVAIAALVAGIGVTAIFSLCLLGASRASERRRAGRSAGAWTLLAVVAGAGVLAVSALGIYAVAAL
jgi:hypothetical protein